MGVGLKRSIYIGWDRREQAAYDVAVRSLSRHLSQSIPVHGLVLADLIDRGLYTRPTLRSDEPCVARLWDVISDAPMSTEHACGRFVTPHLARTGWALFMDGDVLVRGDVAELFDGLDPRFAVYCVKHDYAQAEGVKMDAQLQTVYARKNWSSILAWNCDHVANRALTLEMVNSVPGRELHAFSWLTDDLIGELHPKWNHLVGVSPPTDEVAIAHFTLGTPDMEGYENQPFSEEWRAEQRALAA